MFSADCEDSVRCFAPDSLVSCRLFPIPCRAVKCTRSDFIYRLSVNTGFSGKKGFSLLLFWFPSAPCLRVCIETQTMDQRVSITSSDLAPAIA